MRVFVFTLLIIASITLDGAVSAGKKTPTNKEKIIGIWKWSVIFNDNIVTFTDDGKFTMEREHVLDLANGTYEVDGDMLTITASFARDGAGMDKGDSASFKIKSISEKEMVLSAQREAKTETLQFARVPLRAGAKEIVDLDKKTPGILGACGNGA